MTEIVKALWNVLAMMAPWLLGGFLAAGVLAVLMPRAWAEKAMGRAKGWKGVLNAVLIGVPLPICSCGVLPLTQALRKSGASKGASAGFLISTPQTGVDSILATYALLGPVFAVARPMAAFLTGIFGGIVVNAMTKGDDESVSAAKKAGHHCCCHCGDHGHNGHDSSAGCAGEEDGRNVIMRCLGKFDELFGEVVRPLSVGLVIASLVTAFVPDNFFVTAFGGNDWLAMPAMVILGFPMYVCSTASIPIAASMVLKGLSPGAAFVFLMVGPAINAASLSTVTTLIGKGPAIVYSLVISVGAVLCGIVMNLLPFEVLPRVSVCCEVEHLSLFDHMFAGLLVILILRALMPRGKCECGCCCSS